MENTKMAQNKVFGKLKDSGIGPNKEKLEILEEQPCDDWLDQQMVINELKRKKRMSEKEREVINLMPKRGDIWTVDFGSNVGSEIDKVRPAIVVSSARYNETSSIITVIPVSRSARPMRTHIEISSQTTKLGCVEGFGKVEQIRTVSKGRFGSLLGKLNAKGFDKMTEGLRCHFSIMKEELEKGIPLENELE